MDNDGDGKRDCADTADCAGAANFCGTGTPENLACNDGLDNDLNGDRDCEDAACAGLSCGTGCTCVARVKAETTCSDGLDNDGDGLTDCVDPDCAGVGSESSCTDGRDNNCNGLVDCADPACSGTPTCTNLAVGQACASNGQCASQVCRTEASSGWPSGACVAGVNTCSRDAGVSVGCPSGSVCTSDQFGTFCRQGCSGAGGCRQGYSCDDEDNDSSSGSWCVPSCTSDADCAHLGGSYGCNPWSKRCELKDKSLKRYGAACSNDSQCETGQCLGEAGGYCAGPCRASGACAPGGVCASDGQSNDGTWRCYDDCATNADCRAAPYSCRNAPWSSPAPVCYCSRAGEKCQADGDCCTGIPGLPNCVFGICLL